MADQLKTGIEELDALVSRGLPRGELSIFVAPTAETSTKTMFWRAALDKAREDGAVIPYVDAEASLRDSDVKALFGDDPPNGDITP